MKRAPRRWICSQPRGSRVLSHLTRMAAFAISLVVFVQAIEAEAAPNLKSLRPIGARRGATITLTLVGTGLTPGSELITTLPATITRLAPPGDLKIAETELPFLIELRADAPVAAYPIRIRNSDGISNVLLFSVGDYPELSVLKDPEPLPGASRKKTPIPNVQPPIIINSYLRGSERDIFRFSAAAGQSLVFEVEGRRLGSAIDPVIRVLDAASREIAFNDDAPGLGVDARVWLRFPRSEEYRVVVHDSRLSEQDQSFYRLKIGNYLFADGLFPLGWRRGERVKVEFFGGNLPKPLVYEPNLDFPASQTLAMLSLPESKGRAGSFPLPFALGDREEILEPDGKDLKILPTDTMVNGRISAPGERDLYRLKVNPGDQWLIEVQAATLGTTRLGAHLGIYDSDMKLLKSVVDARALNPPTAFSFVPPEKGVDPKIVFKVPESRVQGLKELILCVEDLNQGGGPDFAYRLYATRNYEDFDLEFVTPFANVPAGGSTAVAVRVVRHSYSGPIRLTASDTKGLFDVEGGHIPRRIREGILVISAKPGTSFAVEDLEVWGEAKSSSGKLIHRRVRGPGLLTPVRGARRQVGGSDVATQKPYMANWLGMELPLGIAKPPSMTLDVSEREFTLVQGHKHNLRLKLTRHAPSATPVRIEGTRPGGIDISIRGGSIDPKADSATVEVSANSSAAVGRFDLVLTARVELGGKTEQVASRSLRVDLVRAFAVILASSTFETNSGSSCRLVGKIHRQYPFQDAVNITAEDLPIHVACEPVQVSDHESEFGLNFVVGAQAVPGEYDIRLVATTRMEGRKDAKDYSVPDMRLKLRIVPKATESQSQRERR